MGPENSATRSALLDAAEAVMLKEGYAALSARSVAERAGLKHQLVYYYFQTMDDLLLAAYRRRSEQTLAKVEQALDSDQPLHALWKVLSDTSGSALAFEYMAMSNHNAAIRAETMALGERIHRMEAAKLSDRIREAAPAPEVFTPLAIIMAISSIAYNLGFESALGISTGHDEMHKLVAWSLSKLESGAAPAKTAKKPKKAADA
jgi:AcrR family transcriptional regulator